jgi:hypothetical protein
MSYNMFHGFIAVKKCLKLTELESMRVSSDRKPIKQLGTDRTNYKSMRRKSYGTASLWYSIHTLTFLFSVVFACCNQFKKLQVPVLKTLHCVFIAVISTVASVRFPDLSNVCRVQCA